MDPDLLLLLAPVPVLGIALIVVVIWLLGGRKRGHLTDIADARRRAADALFGFTGGEVLLACHGEGALVRAAEGPEVAVLIPLGDRFVARLLEPGTISTIKHRSDSDGVELTIRTADFTMRRMRLRLSMVDAPTAERWLAPLRRTQAAAVA